MLYKLSIWGITMRSIIVTMMLLFSGSAAAIPVTWTFQDVVFDDGGVVTGSFIFDADRLPTDNNSYTDISVISTDGSSLTGASFADCLFLCSSSTTVAFETPDRVQRLWIKLDEGMTNSGGTISLTQGCLPEPCGSFEDTYPTTGDRLIISGVITAVPVPAAVWLFGSALAGLGWFRRKTA
jgi:hypothetical protein